jgi:aminoglycoside phosphotransferase (APT) family kinase protein
MRSTSKIVLDRGTIARLSEKYLGKTLVNSREITDGWFNTIHILELSDASRAVLKISPPPAFEAMRYEQNIMATETAVLRRLTQEGLRAPRVLADCPNGDELGHAWFIMEFLEGETWANLRKSLPQEQCDLVDTQIAHQAALVNRIEGERFGRWGEDHCSSLIWSVSFLTMLEDLHADARDKCVQLPRPEADLRELFQASKADLDEVKIPRLVLWDLHDGNVMVKHDSLELVGFLDTDRAIWGDPLIEFYFRSLANSSAAWKDAYRKTCTASGGIHLLDTPSANRRMALYDLYLALVMVVEVAYRGFGPEHDAWVRGFCNQALAICDNVRC